MSIDRCRWCDNPYDQDYDAEHEDACESNPVNQPLKIEHENIHSFTMGGVFVKQINDSISIRNRRGMVLGLTYDEAKTTYDLLGKMIADNEPFKQ